MLKTVFHLWLGLLAIAPPVLAGESLRHLALRSGPYF